jgi:DNA-directed RNA polymerase subunit K/omega
MDYKKVKTESTTITRDLKTFDKEVGNIYEATVILSKRANQISLEMKEELHRKLDEFATAQDNLEEIFENREQIEIAKFYERLPKPTLIAIHEFLNSKLYFRNPIREKKESELEEKGAF